MLDIVSCSEPPLLSLKDTVDMNIGPPAATPPKTNDSETTNPRLPNNTLFKTRRTNANEFRTGTLEQHRTAVVEDLDEVPVVSVEYFLKNTPIPRITDRQLTTLRNQLAAQGLLSQGRWTGFPDDPSQSGQHEDRTFKPLVEIYAAISKRKGHATVKMGYQPHSTPVSERANTTRPDADFNLVEGDATLKDEETETQKTSWANIVMAFEFKRQDSLDAMQGVRMVAVLSHLSRYSYFGFHQNHRRLIWDAFHILRNDPCRLFTFGFTIENTTARMWYFSRSHIMVSQPFHLISVR